MLNELEKEKIRNKLTKTETICNNGINTIIHVERYYGMKRFIRLREDSILLKMACSLDYII